MRFKKNQLRNSILMLLLALFCSLVTFAQHDHSSHGISHTAHVEQPPHGGIIKEAGKYKIEMVAELFLKKDQLRFYLYKGNFKVILNQGITGEVAIKGANGKIIEQSLQAKGDDFFVAQINNPGSFQVTVKFIIKGKTISRVFALKGYGNNTKEKKAVDPHEGHKH